MLSKEVQKQNDENRKKRHIRQTIEAKNDRKQQHMRQRLIEQEKNHKNKGKIGKKML